MERRVGTELRAVVDDAGNPILEGTAIVFDQESADLGGFREIIERGAVRFEGDVVADFDHQTQYILGRQSNGTLDIFTDARGVHFRAKPPKAQWVTDLITSVRGGYIAQCSFEFMAMDDKWDRDDRGIVRRVTDALVSALSIVSRPAYPQTSVEARAKAAQTLDHKENDMSEYIIFEQRAADMRERAEIATGRGETAGAAKLKADADALETRATQLREAEMAEIRAAVATIPAAQSGDLKADYDNIRAMLRGERRASLSTTDANGGYVIAEPLHARLMDIARNADPIFAGAAKFDLSGGANSMKLPDKTARGAVLWAGETDVAAETNSPTFDSGTLECFDLYGYYFATRLFIDSVPESSQIITDDLAASIYEEAAEQFAVGAEVGKPAGLFANTGVGGYTSVHSGSASELVNTAFLTAYTTLHPKFRAKATWLLNGGTLAAIAAMAYPGLDDTPLVTWRDGTAYIFGRPVAETYNAPDVAGGTFPVALADLANAYAVGSHIPNGIVFGVDNITAPMTVKTFGLARLGGTPWSSAAAVLIEVATAGS
jgi:HK97 family phage major capsid protein/HK97 family phage prohead protease